MKLYCLSEVIIIEREIGLLNDKPKKFEVDLSPFKLSIWSMLNILAWLISFFFFFGSKYIIIELSPTKLELCSLVLKTRVDIVKEVPLA